MKSAFKHDIAGLRFGKLTVVEFAGRAGSANTASWLCRCDCDSEILVQSYDLRSGRRRSCGCLKRESVTTHGMCETTEYAIWMHMKHRCYDPKDISFKNYGGRGITVCDRWLAFDNFFEDMGLRPSTSHSLDRKDNSKGYYKENCKWSTRTEQNNNKRNNRVVVFNGLAMTIAGWSRHLRVNSKALKSRFNTGWSDEDALTIPIVSKRKQQNI